jgi:arylsulfatase A-like enzyme
MSYPVAPGIRLAGFRTVLYGAPTLRLDHCRLAVLRWGFILSSPLLLAACDRAQDSIPSPIRLADARHLSQGGLAQVPTASVGGVRRPVLSPWRRSLVQRSLERIDTPHPVTVAVPFTDQMRTGPLRLDAMLTVMKQPIPDVARQLVETVGHSLGDKAEQRTSVAPVLIEEPKASATVEVTIPPGRATGDVLVEVFARPIEDEWTSDPVELPARAALRFGLAIDPTDAASNLTSATVEVAVVEGDKAEVAYSLSLPAPGIGSDRWYDQEVDLAAWSGRKVRLRFTTRAPERSATTPLPPAILWSDPTIVARPRGEAKRVNLILISLDTLRADHLGSYGYARPTSPTIDAWLAARGTLFERVSTSFPHTAGSHMTMLTGLDPCVHGLDRTAWNDIHRVRDEVTTVAEVLRAAGYDTAAFTENAWVTADIGYDRGFGTFVEDSGTGLNLGNVETTFRRGVEWLDDHRSRPFFLFLHTYQVHEPYVPPAGYLEQVASGHATDRNSADLALYDGEIRYTDDVLAGFLAAVTAQGLDENTLIVLTADHGQHFGEHGAFGHGATLWEPVLHVPLVLRGPGVPAGARVPEVAGLIDVLPTVLELLGIAPPSGIQGRSLVPTLRGEALPARTLYAELPERTFLVARRGSLKLMIDEKAGLAGRSAFDLAADPGEQHDIAATLPAGLWDEIASDRRAHCRRGAAPRPTGDGGGAALGGDVRRKLEALGYAE